MTLSAAEIIARLEEAGATLLALIEAYGWDSVRIRPAIPAADKIDRMDEAMGWLTLIPRNRYVLRRIVGARSLVHPISDRHLFSWRRLAAALGANHKAVQRWHANGIDIIAQALTDVAEEDASA